MQPKHILMTCNIIVKGQMVRLQDTWNIVLLVNDWSQILVKKIDTCKLINEGSLDT